MSWQGWAQIVVFLVAARRRGEAARRVHGARLRGRADRPREGRSAGSSASSTALCGVPRDAEQREMSWTTYAVAMLLFNGVGIVVVYAIQRLQARPAAQPGRDGRGVAGPVVEHRRQLRHQHELAELRRRDDDELPHADGRARRAELRLRRVGHGRHGRAHPRHLAQDDARRSATSGSISTRSTLYILLPLSIVLALVFVSQGVVQTFSAAHHVALLQATKDADGNAVTDQVLAVGPGRLAEAIKQLGTNGGGFFNANAAHPFENPTPLSNFLKIYALLLIPAALTYTFGKMVKDTRQGWAVLGGDVRRVPAAALPVRDAGAGGQPGARVARTSTRRRARCSPAATWRARRSASASRRRASSRRRRPASRAAPSTRCTTPSRRSAASCRCSSSSSARSSSAASAPACTACSCSPSSPSSSPG